MEEDVISNWRFRWLSLVFEFSHIEYQKGLWIDQKYENEIGWFGEDMCRYFDDLYLDDNYLYQLENGYVSQEEFNTIREFHSALDNYNENGKSDLEIIKDPLWISIVEQGKTSWEKLKNNIRNEDELHYMKKIEDDYLQ